MFPNIGGHCTYKSPITNQDLMMTRSHGLRSVSVPMNRCVGHDVRNQRHWQTEKAAKHFHRGSPKVSPNPTCPALAMFTVPKT